MSLKSFNPVSLRGRVFPICFVLLTLIFSLQSCYQGVVFDDNKPVNKEAWHYQEEIVFTLQINDTISLHDIYFNVRNNTNYPYSNLIVFFTTEFPDGRLFKDTLECMLADKSGKWTGSGFGRIKSNSFHFRKDVWFPLMGEHNFILQQAMREENLEGITDVGIRIERK